MAKTKVGRKITARFSRDESGAWIVEFPEIPGAHTYGRSLREAKRRIPEVLKLFDIESDSSEIVETFELAEPAIHAIEQLQRDRADLNRAAEAARGSLDRTLVELMDGLKLSTRDTADLVGVSHQRVSQMSRSRGPAPGRRRPRRAAGPLDRE